MKKALVCAVILILVYWQDILPLKRELVFSKQQEKLLTEQLQNLYYQETSLEEKMGELPEANTTLNEWQKKFIKYSDSSKLLKEVVIISKKDNLQVRSFDSISLNYENNYWKQSFKMVLIGDYGQIAQFIEQIGNLPWTVVVGNFSLSRLFPNETSQLFSTELELSLLYHR